MQITRKITNAQPLWGLLCFLIAISFLGCGEETGDSESATTSNTTETDTGDTESEENEEGATESSGESSTSACGDETCTKDETCETCPEDCGECEEESGGSGESCGDTVCDGSETCANCPEDCGDCPGQCPDGVCGEDESCSDCPEDCPCSTVCGDGSCTDSETCLTCEEDCGACPDLCGDANCGDDEDCTGCPVDCGPCPTEEVCGNEICDRNETCDTCAVDCGVCSETCGDNACGEDETCESCPQDCGNCNCAPPEVALPVKGNVLCRVVGCSGTSIDCQLLVARETENVEAPVGLQFKLNYDPTVLLLDNFYDEVCFTEDLCVESPLTKTGSLGNHTGHNFQVSPPGEVPSNPAPGTQYLWNGLVNVIVVHFGGSEFPLTDAYAEADGNIAGDPFISLIRFTLLTELGEDDPSDVWLSTDGANELLAVGSSLVDLPATVVEGVIITSGPPQ